MLVKALAKCVAEEIGARNYVHWFNSLTLDNMYQLADVFVCVMDKISGELGVSFNPQTGSLPLIIDFVRRDIESGAFFTGEILKDVPNTVSRIADRLYTWCRELTQFVDKKITNTAVANQILNAFAVCKNFSYKKAEVGEFAVYMMNLPIFDPLYNDVVMLPFIAFTSKIGDLSFLQLYNSQPYILTMRWHTLLYTVPIIMLPENTKSIERATGYISDAANVEILDVIPANQLTAEVITEIINDYFARMSVRREHVEYLQLPDRVEVEQVIEHGGRRCEVSSVADSYFSTLYDVICTAGDEIQLRCSARGRSIAC